MRLLTLSVRNYRVHREVTFEFDPSLNLIGGPNESGKSTLAEAAHRALFLRSKTGGAVRAEMVSTLHGGHPEVDLSFHAWGERWDLRKCFAATKGSTRLTNSAGRTLLDDEAEAKLGDLLRCETNGGRLTANQLPLVWSHLWVWQGNSGTDPCHHASEHKDTLVQRLQQEGIAAVMQSATDQTVRDRIAALHDELFTTQGRPKASSKPEAARAAMEAARSELDRAEQTAAKLAQDAEDFARADQVVTEVGALLPRLREQLTATEAKLTDATKLRHEEERCGQHAEAATADLKRRLANDAEISSLTAKTKAAREALVPTDRRDADLLENEKKLRDRSRLAEVAYREADAELRRTKQEAELAVAVVAGHERAAEHGRLTAVAEEAGALRQKIALRREELSRLPAIEPRDMESLRKLGAAADQATAALTAMATAVELVSTARPTTLDGHPFATGEVRILTDEGELQVGQTVIRIRPGGGTGLAAARLQQQQSAAAFTAALERHALRDLDHAAAVLQQRQILSREIGESEASWKAMGGDRVSKQLATASEALEAAKAEITRRANVIGASPSELAPASASADRERYTRLEQDLRSSEQAEAQTRPRAAQARLDLEQAEATLKKHREDTAQARQELAELEHRLKILTEFHGPQPEREKAIAEARETESRVTHNLQRIRKQLAELAPEALTADRERLMRSISQQDDRRQQAETTRAITADRLQSDGTRDPAADLAVARACFNSAEQAYAALAHRALAIHKLHELFISSQEALSQSIVRPLADRITGYLRCLFGPSAEARMVIADDRIDDLEILRDSGPAFGFSTLSGGAKEQVAAATRLAMAEILAADHDGTLPIIFDDAFAYSDPNRIQILQRMLDLAANRGLQLIVLTCDPTQYAALGAGRSLSLNSPTPAGSLIA